LLPAASASSSPQYFSDNFNGTSLDSSKWTVLPPQNGTGAPAFGGSIVVNNSLSMSSNGSTFPCITSAVNPFPSTGNFAIQFDITYTHIDTYGSGIVISDDLARPEGKITNDSATPPSDPLSAHGLKVWGDPTGVNVFFFGNWVYKTDWNWAPGGFTSTYKLLFRLEYTEGVYSLYLNDKFIATQESNCRPNIIAVGHPLVPYLPLAISSGPFGGSDMADWTAFTIDQIAMLPPTNLSLGTSATSTGLGLTVNCSGTLTNSDGSPIMGTPVILSYLVSSASSWTPIASAITDSKGAFATTWFPTATGEFSIKAQWIGNDSSSGTFDAKNVSVYYDGQQPLFYVESNSTLSALTFNSTANELSFSVSGDSGTTGYVKFLISKDVLPNATDLKLYMDNQTTTYSVTSTGSSWLIFFTYHHSTHNVVMMLSSVSAVPEFTPAILLLALAIIVPSLAAVGKTKKHHSKRS